MYGVVARTTPCDKVVPIADIASVLNVSVSKLIGELQDFGWADCNKHSTLPPIMADVAIDYFAGDVPIAPDDDPIIDPGLPEHGDHPAYAVGDMTKADLVLA